MGSRIKVRYVKCDAGVLNGSRWDQSVLCQMRHVLCRVLASTDRTGVTAVKEGILMALHSGTQVPDHHQHQVVP